jgi:hypothetical protein
VALSERSKPSIPICFAAAPALTSMVTSAMALPPVAAMRVAVAKAMKGPLDAQLRTRFMVVISPA